MGEILGAFVIFLMMVGLVAITVKYRKTILEWLNKNPDPKRKAKSGEMEDFDTLTLLGISEDDAIERIRRYRVHRKEVSEAIAQDDEKPEQKAD